MHILSCCHCREEGGRPFYAARFRELEDVIAPNGILVMPGLKTIIGREGKFIKLEGFQILKSLNNKKYNDYAHYQCGEKIDKEGSVNFLFQVSLIDIIVSFLSEFCF